MPKISHRCRGVSRQSAGYRRAEALPDGHAVDVSQNELILPVNWLLYLPHLYLPHPSPACNTNQSPIIAAQNGPAVLRHWSSIPAVEKGLPRQYRFPINRGRLIGCELLLSGLYPADLDGISHWRRAFRIVSVS
jgi:hypothetical protein